MEERKSVGPQDYIEAARRDLSQARGDKTLEPLLLEKLAKIGESAEAVARLDVKLKAVIKHAKERAISPGADKLPDKMEALGITDTYIKAILNPEEHVRLGQDGEVYYRDVLKKSWGRVSRNMKDALMWHQNKMISGLEEYLNSYIDEVAWHKTHT